MRSPQGDHELIRFDRFANGFVFGARNGLNATSSRS
jgi:hypothetical protein